tara:strand:+ start:236 stop:580 length:345 start_codon:yes stop_codon:yes gene_type:complete
MTKRTYKHWSMADDAELVMMRAAKVPTKIIARDLKRTPSSVVNRIYQNNIPWGIPSEEIAKKGIAFGEPDYFNVKNERERQIIELQSIQDVFQEMEKDIKPSNWFPRLKRWFGF